MFHNILNRFKFSCLTTTGEGMNILENVFMNLPRWVQNFFLNTLELEICFSVCVPKTAQQSSHKNHSKLTHSNMYFKNIARCPRQNTCVNRLGL